MLVICFDAPSTAAPDHLSAQYKGYLPTSAECKQKMACFSIELAGRLGLEPRLQGPEPCVLPLDDLPMLNFVFYHHQQ